jgi:hypothetical protein
MNTKTLYQNNDITVQRIQRGFPVGVEYKVTDATGCGFTQDTCPPLNDDVLRFLIREHNVMRHELCAVDDDTHHMVDDEI